MSLNEALKISHFLQDFIAFIFISLKRILLSSFSLKNHCRWDFKTHNLDIKFGVQAVNNATGEKFNEVELKRVEAFEGQTGFIATEPNHTCKKI